MRAFIVTTVRNPGPPLVSFVRYHLQLGFERILIFFDDPADPWLPVARGLAGVTAITCSDELRERQWEKAPNFEQMRSFVRGEVMARQVLNADHAIDLALQQGADWLLHLDIDELFCCAESVSSHFAGISPDVAQVSYLNHEAAPEQADMEDYFREVTLFKVNPALCPFEAMDQWWRSRRRRWFFVGYDNGKAAVRLRPGVAAKGVHLFETPPGSGQTIQINYPCVLHYANCGFGWYRQKYQHRGSFADTMFDRLPRLRFQLESREALARQDLAAQKRFHAEQVVYSDVGEVSRMLAAGLGIRITAPRRILDAP